MIVSETIERSVRLRGPCSSWLPIVRDSLSAHGCRRIAVDESTHTLTADFGIVPVSGSIVVSLSPGIGGGTDVSVTASAKM